MEAFIHTLTSFYCLFWFESVVWWVNEGLWVQLSVVMRPLPHSDSLGHNKSATPNLGFSAAPAEGSWRKLGGSAPSPLKCPSLWIRQQELLSDEAVKRTQLLLAPTQRSHLPPSPCTLLTIGTLDWSFAVQNTTGLGSQRPGANNCIWFVRLWGYINIMSSLITSGSSLPQSFSENESVTWKKTKKNCVKNLVYIHMC